MRIYLIALIWLLAGCSSTEKPSQGALPVDEAILGDWQVISVGSASVVSNSQVLLSFDADKVAGSSGCNRFFGGYQLVDAGLKIGNLGSTRRLCESALMVQESAVFSALDRVRSVKLIEGTLVLSDESGAVLLRAER